MIFVVCNNRSRATGYLVTVRRVNPLGHAVITTPGEARATFPKPTEEDEIVFLGSELNAWDFFSSFDKL